MKDFLTQNLDLILSAIGVIVLITVIHYAKFIIGTKYEVILNFYIFITLVIGTVTTWSAIAKWILE